MARPYHRIWVEASGGGRRLIGPGTGWGTRGTWRRGGRGWWRDDRARTEACPDRDGVSLLGAGYLASRASGERRGSPGDLVASLVAARAKGPNRSRRRKTTRSTRVGSEEFRGVYFIIC